MSFCLKCIECMIYDYHISKISNQKLLQYTGNAMTSSVIEKIAKNLMNAIGEKRMIEKEILINRGSTTAKNGFKNEVVDR